ncbi:MAG TPA: hypothetical protein VES66_10880 [Terriglobales bacterium]|nr:hypothetical protein [Terriglobales bacterium]
MDRKPVSAGDEAHPRPMNSARFDQHLNAAPPPQEPGDLAAKPVRRARGCCGT